MTTIRILVTRQLPPENEERLKRLFDATLNADDHVMTPEEIIEKTSGCSGMLVTSLDKFPRDMVSKLPDSIKIMASFSAGYEHMDVAACKERGIVATNTPDVLTDATADMAILCMMGAARGAYWGERMVRERKWAPWKALDPIGYDFSGQRLGILGMGRIGQAVAKRAAAFGMELHYHNRSDLPAALAHGARYHRRFEDMLPHCDFLSVNCASTPATRGIINAKTLALLPKGAIFANSARGDVVDEDALITALKSGHLAAAGLDVFRNEPNIDPRFAELPNVFLMPHLGSATIRTRTAMGDRAIDNLEAYFAGRPPRDVLNA
jgi:lactate dehydrogenase-like 2-hydroxyacid dehydrogenase